jgi:hypothetical protein
MAKDPASWQSGSWNARSTRANTRDSGSSLYWAERGILETRPSCTVGLAMILIVGSMICSTSWPIRRFCWWRGIGCGATRVRARREWTGRPPATSGPCVGWRGSWGTAHPLERPHGCGNCCVREYGIRPH